MITFPSFSYSIYKPCNYSHLYILPIKMEAVGPSPVKDKSMLICHSRSYPSVYFKDLTGLVLPLSFS